MPKPITVAETQIFARAAAQIWTEDERADSVDFIARSPEAGDIIKGAA
jgi:hypothetical protein